MTGAPSANTEDLSRARCSSSTLQILPPDAEPEVMSARLKKPSSGSERDSDRPHDFSPGAEIEERRSLSTSPQQIGLLERVSSFVNEAPTVDDALRFMLAELCGVCGPSIGHAALLDPSSGSSPQERPSDLWHVEGLPALTAADLRWSILPHATRLRRELGEAGRYVHFEVDGAPQSRDSSEARPLGISSALAIPVFVGPEMACFLEIFVTGSFSADEHFLRLSTQAASQLARVIERQRSSDRLIHELNHDPLTRLCNRSFFHSLATRTMAGSQPVALVLLDLDHFRLINDGLGHDRGDHLLVEVGRRFAEHCHHGAQLARLGGDEFAVLLSSDEPVIAAASLAGRLQESLLRPIEFDRRKWSLSCSIGVAASMSGRPESKCRDRTIGDLLRNAEVAMYHAKKEGRNRIVVFDTTMHKTALERLTLDADLHAALERNEFVLYLQPLVRLADGRLKGFEALARWMRPDHGLVMPSMFISALEDNGLVTSFGYWIVREACSILVEWQRRFPGTDLPPISVNLSARQFEDPELFPTICGIVEEAGISPSSLRFEVTESLTMQDPKHVADVLGRFTRLGFGVSLDDFGTGYSSLGYLQSFPVDNLKIDRSFVARMQEEGGNLRIVRAILGLAASLGVAVVGEGIETAEQAALLVQLGCCYGQGYHFGRPAPVAEATRLVEATRVTRTDGSTASEVPFEESGPAPAAVRTTARGIRALLGPEIVERSRHGRLSRSQDLETPRLPGMAAWTRSAAASLWTLRWFLVAPVFMALHATLILAFPTQGATLTALCLAVGPAMAAATAWRTAQRTTSGLRANWMIAALAFAFWAAGSLLAVWMPMGSSANVIDFLYFLCSISLLFAMTAPENDEPRWLFLLMDGLQALLGAFLGYTMIFGAVPFTTQRIIPLDGTSILWTYDGENICMALLAVLRLFGGDGSSMRRQFDVSMLLFTLSFGTLGSLYDHVSPPEASPLDVMLDPAFFLVAAVLMLPWQARGAATRPARLSRAVLNTVGPIFFTAAVLMVAAWITRQRPVPGVICIVATVVIYAVRVSLLQARYIMTQQRLRQTRDRLESLALQDGLTGVGNRRAFDTALADMWSACNRDTMPLSALLVDVDFFKAYNDRHGHLTGDACLTALADVLKAIALRSNGFVARYGGEEFVILLPDAAHVAATVASTIRQAMATTDIMSHTGVPAPITVSIGVATSDGLTSAQALMLAADDALYRAKQRGRDRVEVAALNTAVLV